MNRRINLDLAFILLLVITVWFSMGGLPANLMETVYASKDTDLLTVYFFDVGQGDATLLAGPDFTILIDAGRHDRHDVVPHLNAVGVESLDLFVGTHPHSDHIGQFAQVLQSFPVQEVWMPGNLHTTRTFERAIDAILASDAAYHEPKAGERFQIGSALIEVVHPGRLTDHFNNDSIGLRITYRNIQFLFTGDAEQEAEAAMVKRGATPLKAHILHIGHHGSRTSSTISFLNAVEPEVGIYSAGIDNTYGHPHAEVMARFKRLGITVYGTDVHGTVQVVTDGERYWVKTERGAEAVAQSQCLPGQINVNTASKNELTRIRHIGSTRADEILQLRPLASLEDLLQISGIGSARLNDILSEGLACL